MRYFLLLLLLSCSALCSAQFSSKINGNWELLQIANKETKEEIESGEYLKSYKIKIVNKKILYNNLCNACCGRLIIMKSGKLIVQESCNEGSCKGGKTPFVDFIPFEELTKFSVKGKYMTLENDKVTMLFEKYANSSIQWEGDIVEWPVDVWGVGLISNRSGNEEKKVSLPVEGVNIYKESSGTKIGKIKHNKGNDDTSLPLTLIKNGSLLEINMYDLKGVDLEGKCLKYYKEESGYVQVLTASINNGVWLKISELKKQDFFIQTWMDFLLNRDGMFYPIKEGRSGLKLMLEPLESSNLHDNLVGKRYKVRLTGKIKNNWFQVKVEEYSKNPCDTSAAFIMDQKGWIKALSENGDPNIWFDSRGCK